MIFEQFEQFSIRITYHTLLVFVHTKTKAIASPGYPSCSSGLRRNLENEKKNDEVWRTYTWTDIRMDRQEGRNSDEKLLYSFYSVKNMGKLNDRVLKYLRLILRSHWENNDDLFSYKSFLSFWVTADLHCLFFFVFFSILSH